MLIRKVKYLFDYVLQVIFEDGTERKINLEKFITGSDHPLIKKYSDPVLFKKFKLKNGTITWGNNEFDLNPFKIYEGHYNA